MFSTNSLNYRHINCMPVPFLGDILSFLGITKEKEPEGPKNIQEVIKSLPEPFIAYCRENQPYRHASALIFILIVFGLGGPLWYHTTKVPRAEFPVYEKDFSIPLNVRIVLAVTDKQLLPKLPAIADELIDYLEKEDVQQPLSIKWEFINEGVKELSQLETDFSSTDSLEVRVALVPSSEWPHFSATNVYLGRYSWSFIQWTEEPEQKLMHRLKELVSEVLVDVPHLNVIIKRDLRERMQPWQIATLPLSHQKRLVWDSAPLSMNYVVQVVYLHDNDSPRAAEKTKSSLNGLISKLAKKVSDTTSIEVSSEHLWDFDVSAYLEKDVQDRWTLTYSGMERLTFQIDDQMQTVESEHPLLRIAIIETDKDVILLDQFGDDSPGAVVAAWGAVIPRNEKTPSRVIASLRVLLGLDSDLTSGWARDPVPLAEWELSRLKMRALVDNTMRSVTNVATLKALTEKISTIAIGEDVAQRVRKSVGLVREAESLKSVKYSLHKVKQARHLSDEAIYHKSLLALLYFPQDQKVAVYLPIMLPTLLPLLGSAWTILKWLVFRNDDPTA